MSRRGWTLFAVLGVVGVCEACADAGVANLQDEPRPTLVPEGDAGSADAIAADAETPVEACRPDALCANPLLDPTSSTSALDLRTRVNVIRGRSATDVWLAGAVGALAHFDGTSWTPSDVGSRESLSELWLHDTAEIAVVDLTTMLARGGEIDRDTPSSDGWGRAQNVVVPSALAASSRRVTSTWTAPGVEWTWGTTLEGASDSRQSGLWRARVVSATGAIELDAALPPGTCATLGCRQMTSIHGSSASDLWAVGARGAIFHITDAQGPNPVLEPFDSQTWVQLNGVWVASASEAFAVGGMGTIHHYTAGTKSWEAMPDVPASETLRAVWGTSRSDVWVVGDGACVLHFDGQDWSRVDVLGLGGRRPDLYAVWTPAPGHVWVGGEGVLLSLGGKP